MKRLSCALVLSLSFLASAENITVDASSPSHPFPHFWEQMFGSGRAVLSLRDSYRIDLRSVRDITHFDTFAFTTFWTMTSPSTTKMRKVSPSTTFPMSTRSTMACWQITSSRSSN